MICFQALVFGGSVTQMLFLEILRRQACDLEQQRLCKDADWLVRAVGKKEKRMGTYMFYFLFLITSKDRFMNSFKIFIQME